MGLRPKPHRSRSMAHNERLVAAFNRKHPVGSQILVWSGLMGEGPGRLATIVEPGARVLSGHTPVVQVSGGGGCIALTHVKPAPAGGRQCR